MAGEVEPAWRTVDTALRGIAQRRAALDAAEARWLREAEALQIWRPLGLVNALDYMERVLGYAPRAAQERLRVATPTTEAAWAGAGAGKNLRQIEELVAGHRPGDLPDDPADPEVRTRVVRFELSPETFAMLRQARAVLDDDHGAHLDDDGFIAMLAAAVLDGGGVAAPDGGIDEPEASDGGEAPPITSVSARDAPSGRARFQLAVTICGRARGVRCAAPRLAGCRGAGACLPGCLASCGTPGLAPRRRGGTVIDLVAAE